MELAGVGHGLITLICRPGRRSPVEQGGRRKIISVWAVWAARGPAGRPHRNRTVANAV